MKKMCLKMKELKEKAENKGNPKKRLKIRKTEKKNRHQLQ